jgi:hypothetical protein
MRLVGPWAVFGNGDRMPMTTRTRMRSHALTFIEKLNGRRCRAHFHQLVHQVVGNAVVVRVEGDVVIDVHTGANRVNSVLE